MQQSDVITQSHEGRAARAILPTSWIERHWLHLLLIALGVWTLAPWLAPLFMHLGWTGPGRAVYAVYSAFCHQMPQRSWFFFGEQFTYSLDQIGAAWPDSATMMGVRRFVGNESMGWKLAWSDRMVSFYGGFFLFGLLYLALRDRILRSGWQMSWRWLVVLVMPVVLDGVSHMISDLGGLGAGFRETNLWLAELTNHVLAPAFYAGDGWGSFNSIMRLVTGLLASFAIIFWAFPRIDDAFMPGVCEKESLNRKSAGSLD